jgi:hypothetical protein
MFVFLGKAKQHRGAIISNTTHKRMQMDATGIIDPNIATEEGAEILRTYKEITGLLRIRFIFIF